MAVSGFGGLALTGSLPLALVVVGATALALSLVRLRASNKDQATLTLSQEAWNVLLIAVFFVFVIDLLWISRDLLHALVHFLVLLMVIKLFNLRDRSDFLHLYGLSQMALLATAVLTVELWYAAVFVVYLLAAIWTMLLYHLKSEAQEASSERKDDGLPDDSGGKGLITARFFWTTNGIALGAFVVTLAIFFVTPRIGAGFFKKNQAEVIRTTGFSDRVDLGVIGAVKQDFSVVMRVEFPDEKGPLTERFYFRGAAYDRYNGHSWGNTLSQRRDLLMVSDRTFHIGSDSPVRRAGPGLHQVIVVEALDTAALFGVSFVESVKGHFRFLQADGMDNLFLPYPPASRFQYTARSRPRHLLRTDRLGTSFTYPASVRQRFLQLPPMSPRVAALAREITREATSPFRMVTAVERHLRGSYRYSLDVGMVVSKNPVEDFLFTRKTGYCEHYATAMVVMLRTLGIPARLATGFLPGEWNEFGQYYTVRQRDAHAWVEVYFPRSGWVTFDPTPSSLVVASNPLWSRIEQVIDSMRLKWDRFVIQYSFRDQIAVVRDIRERGDRVRSQISGWWAAFSTWVEHLYQQVTASLRPWLFPMVGLLVVSLVLIGVLLAVRYRRNPWMSRWQSDGYTAEQVRVMRLYTRMLGLLDARGIGKHASATALEYAAFIAREWSDASHFVTPLTELYCQVRFGRAPFSREDLVRANALLAGLRAACQ